MHKEYSGRTGISKWLYIHEDWWLPIVLMMFAFFIPVIVVIILVVFSDEQTPNDDIDRGKFKHGHHMHREYLRDKWKEENKNK